MEIPTLCEHLRPLADHLIAAGIKVTFAGQAWSTNCRTWIYFDTELNIEELKARFALTTPVTVHTNEDTHSGLERGFVCTQHHDAVIGLYNHQRP
jgi:hypothetical protein